MPMIEMLAPDRLAERAAAAAPSFCGSLARVWDVSEQIVTIYRLPLAPGDYVHAGAVEGEPARVFIKVHGFRRSIEARRAAAEALTACCTAQGIPAQNVIIYFLERTPDEVAHGGKLQSQ